MEVNKIVTIYCKKCIVLTTLNIKLLTISSNFVDNTAQLQEIW
jgi:hypothetical protein